MRSKFLTQLTKPALPKSIGYYSTVDFSKIRSIPKILTESELSFKSCLEDSCKMLAKDSVQKDLFSTVEYDFKTNIEQLKKTELSTVKPLRARYDANLKSLYLALSRKFDIEGEQQKTIAINILGTQLSLVTFFHDLKDPVHTQVLSSFICYEGFPLAYSANAISLALSANNRNIHHFALGELPKKIPTMQEYDLFGNSLVMSLVQISLPLLVEDKINLGYQRISCRENDSLKAQKEISGIEERRSSNFPRVYAFAVAFLEKIANDLGNVRPDYKGAPSIAVGSEIIFAAPSSETKLTAIDMIASGTPLGKSR